VIGPYMAATLITLLQYLRLRERRLLPLAALFAFQVQALSREWWDAWRHVYQGAACLSGLLLLLALTLRHPAALKPAAPHLPPESAAARSAPEAKPPSA
jgi:hypothetical protein